MAEEAEFVLGLSGEMLIRAEEVKGRNKRDRNWGVEAMSTRRRGRRMKKTRERREKRRGRIGNLMLMRSRYVIGK